MPLLGTHAALAALMEAELEAAMAPFAESNTIPPSRVTFEALAKAIINHIVATAVVAVPSVTGVTTGGGVSGPGVGTIT